MFKLKNLPILLLLSFLILSVFSSQLLAAEKIVINEMMFSGAAQEVLIEQAKRFMEENPDIEVNITWVDYASLHEKMMTELVGGTGRYDVMAAITDFMPEFIGGGYLEPLDSLIENDPPEGWPDDFPDSLLRYQKDADGKIYGLPWWDGPVMFYYRKDLFENPQEKENFQKEYGYELNPPMTWKEFLDIAQFFTVNLKNIRHLGQEVIYCLTVSELDDYNVDAMKEFITKKEEVVVEKEVTADEC